MTAIGDSEGTVSIMQLCKPLYETSNKEKEVMGQIFEREFKREKNLEISRKLAGDAQAKDKKKADAAKLQVEKEEALKVRIDTINEEFFKHVAEGGQDIDKIKARADKRMAE